MKERLVVKLRVTQKICDDIVREGIDEAITDVASEKYRFD